MPNKSNMRISIFSAFYPFRGGIAHFNDRLVKELEKKHDVATFTFKKQYPNFLFPGKTQFEESGSASNVKNAKRIVSTFNPLTYLRAANEIRASKPDVFITNYWMTFFAPFMAVFGRKLKGKSTRVAILHNFLPHERRFFDKSFNRKLVKNYDGFVVLSEAVKGDLMEMMPNALVLKVEHPLYDHFGEITTKDVALERLTSKFGLKKFDKTKRTLLFFGLIRDYKGLDNLILAMTILPSNYQLIIAGEVYGDERKYLDMIEASGRSGNIHFVNSYITDSEVSPFFVVADLCVLPYKSATQSGITAIAQYLETPVLTTNVGGLKETVEHEKTGFIVEKSDPGLIASGIEQFFLQCNSDEVKKNIQVVKQERSWERFSEQFINFIQELK